jgi:thioredoxin reductase
MLSVAIIGAGPYGLSIAAHFRHRGIPFRIFGRPMDSWLSHMPKGMMLKSDGFASDIYDPARALTLKQFCAEQGIAYADTGIPVRLDTFTAYGLAFRERMVPELEERLVVGLDRLPVGFRLRLDDGEVLAACRVVLAVGITHFPHIPPDLADLPSQYVSHSYHHHELDAFRDRSVVVIGGGASALDLAGLLRDAGAEVQLVARQQSLKFHSGPLSRKRSLWKRFRHPDSGLGPGLRSRFYSDAPGAFYCLPERFRLQIVRTALGPSGGWFIKEKVMGRVPLSLGCTPERAEIQNGSVHLHVRNLDGARREVVTEHVIAATGYRVDLERLAFVSSDIRSKIRTVNGTPVLSSNFESSVPGLYFVGVAAANSFGPVMRFAFGAGFAARTITRAMLKSLPDDPISVPVPGVIASAADEARPVGEEPALQS